MLYEKLMLHLDPRIEFLGLVNKNGRLVNSIKKEDFILDKKTEEILFMSIRLQNSMQEDFSDQFGKLLQIAIEHKQFRFLLLPIGDMIGVAITRTNINDLDQKITMSNLYRLMKSTEIKENEFQ